MYAQNSFLVAFEIAFEAIGVLLIATLTIAISLQRVRLMF